MTDIRIEPTEVQLYVLDKIWEGFRRRKAWPVFDFVDHELNRDFGMDLIDVARSCPSVATDLNNVGYGWLYAEARSFESAQRHTPVGLTLAGMQHVPAAQSYVDLFLEVLRYFVLSERNVEPDPGEVVSASINQSELQSLVTSLTEGRAIDQVAFSAFLQSAMFREPSVWPSNPYAANDGNARLSPHLRRYRDIESLDQYVATVMALAPQPSEEVLHESSLSLPEAIDYIDIKWRLRYGVTLFKESNNTTSAQLILECGSREEFMARCSSLWSILDRVHLPDREGTTLHELNVFLTQQTDDDAAIAQIREATDVLRSTGKIRAAQQHPDTKAWKDQEWAVATIGLQWPPRDWGSAWSEVQRRCVWALALLREQVSG